jgi:hypothetical protein
MNKIIVFANQKGGAYIIRKVDPVNWHGINGVHLKIRSGAVSGARTRDLFCKLQVRTWHIEN